MTEATRIEQRGAGFWVGRFKDYYRELLRSELAELDVLYTADVRFCDPIHCIEGRETLHRYMQSLCTDLSDCRFVYLDQLIGTDTAYMKWDMVFRHPKIRRNSPIAVRGASQIKFSAGGIHYHEDFYDLGAMLYENIPVVGTLTSWLRRRLAH